MQLALSILGEVNAITEWRRPQALMRRLLAVAPLVLAALLINGPAAAQFVPNEIEVCSAAARVYDPEFDFATQQMAYFDGKDGLRVAPVAADGSIGSPDCAGTLVTRRVTISLPDLPYKAGPEWGMSSRGREIYITKLDGSGRPYMARAWFDGRWRQKDLPESSDRGLALVSRDAADADVRLVYMYTPSQGAYTLAWREALSPETERFLPGSVDPRTGGAPRWVPGQRALTMALPDATGNRQAVRYDVDTSEVRFLTTDSGNKDEVWLWAAPEFGGDLALMVVADGCCLRFYREQAAVWKLYREVKVTDFSRRTGIFSPEILVHDGASYVAMQVAKQRTGDSEVWMLGVDPHGLQPVQLSDPSQGGVSRSEPEWMVTSQGVFVYVSASTNGSRFALRRLKTPLVVRN